ncbi:ArsA family ATPase [Nakamurella endophytica]|uniref:Arsenite-transporting ATPase n=1 Tax=Nakamurella endophytica TaxID=1748367 RepID=A0A917T6Z8_9ACTN|nr:TRC40/GET3/ArsA family transport-energizing ATPase [Nakamurella endophytica]GGM12624.1 putative arsenite-transporting ATPase [Nakamurella endophytica]
MRIALHTGKGGVGTSTVAAATAVAAADAGHRTLLLSLAPAAALEDVLGVAVGPDPAAISEVPGLDAAGLDVRLRFEQAWSGVRAQLAGLLTAAGVPEAEPAELTVPPGVDDVLALLELHRVASAGRWDAVVVDGGAADVVVRMLGVPETLSLYLDRLSGARLRMLRGIAGLLPGRGARGATPQAGTGDTIGSLLDRLSAARSLLTDGACTGTRIVLTPDAAALAAARRLRTALAVHGCPVDDVVVTRVLPEAAGPFFGPTVAAQRRQVAETERTFDVPMRTLPLTPEEPVGVDRLRALAATLPGTAGLDGPVTGSGRRPAGPSTEVTDGGYLLRIPVPLAAPGEVDLSRVGDDLVLTVGAVRRRLALPSLLRRCLTTGARLDAGNLVVEFVPDPSRWPAGLRGPAGPVDAADRSAEPGPREGSVPDPASDRGADRGSDPAADGATRTVGVRAGSR